MTYEFPEIIPVKLDHRYIVYKVSIQLKLELISTNQGLKAWTGNRSDVIVGKPRTVSKTSLIFQTDLSIKVVVNTIYELHKSLEFIQRN